MLCLPGNTDISNCSIMYTGEKLLCLPNGNTFLEPYQQASFPLAIGDSELYEYDQTTGAHTSYRFSVMQGSKIPSLYFTIDDVEQTEFDTTLGWLHSDKELKTSGTLYMTNESGEVVYNGLIDTFKGRGNTSFTRPGLQGDKKSYNIKLDKKEELIPGTGKMKKWSLIHMRISEDFDHDWTGLCHQLGYPLCRIGINAFRRLFCSVRQ